MDLIDHLQLMHADALRYEEVYNRYMSSLSTVVNMKNERDQRANETFSTSRNVVLICCLAGAFVVFGSFPLFSNQFLSGIQTLLLGLAIPTVAILVRRHLMNENQEYLRAFDAKYAAELERYAPCEEELAALRQEILDKKYFDVLPYDYFESNTIAYMIDVLRRKVALDMHEAIVLFEQERQRMIDHATNAQMIATLKNSVDINTAVTWLSK